MDDQGRKTMKRRYNSLLQHRRSLKQEFNLTFHAPHSVLKRNNIELHGKTTASASHTYLHFN
jgi:hypothetical protein